jgi:hypothetical protein
MKFRDQIVQICTFERGISAALAGKEDDILILQQTVERSKQALDCLSSVPKISLNQVLDEVKRESEFVNLMKIMKKLQSTNSNQNVASKENQGLGSTFNKAHLSQSIQN